MGEVLPLEELNSMLWAVWYGVLPLELSDKRSPSGDLGAATSDLATFVLITAARGVEQVAMATSDICLALAGLGDAFLFASLTGEALVGDEGDLLPRFSIFVVSLSLARLSRFASL